MVGREGDDTTRTDDAHDAGDGRPPFGRLWRTFGIRDLLAKQFAETLLLACAGLSPRAEPKRVADSLAIIRLGFPYDPLC